MISQHKRFKQRILIERQVLQLVNSHFSPSNQLCGLTDATISRWEKDVFNEKDTDIGTLIRKIALISHASNDISREIFATEELKVVNDSTLLSNIKQLQGRLIEYHK